LAPSPDGTSAGDCWKGIIDPCQVASLHQSRNSCGPEPARPANRSSSLLVSGVSRSDLDAAAGWWMCSADRSTWAKRAGMSERPIAVEDQILTGGTDSPIRHGQRRRPPSSTRRSPLCASTWRRRRDGQSGSTRTISAARSKPKSGGALGGEGEWR